MAALQRLALDKKLARRELKDFRSLLDVKGKGDLSERHDILPFFDTHKQLCVLIGSYNYNINLKASSIAREFDIFGDHVADLAIGDPKSNEYCFVEFEDATVNSIFKQSAKLTPVWSTRYEHGFSQLIDWILWLENNANTAAHSTRFNANQISYNMVLVIGRERHLAKQGLKERFQWRNKSVVVASKHVHCITFDQLYEDLKAKLDIWG